MLSKEFNEAAKYAYDLPYGYVMFNLSPKLCNRKFTVSTNFVREHPTIPYPIFYYNFWEEFMFVIRSVMRYVAIPFRDYKELFSNVKVDSDNIVTGVPRGKVNKKVFKGELINNGGKSQKRYVQ